MQERATIDAGPGGSTGMRRASGGVLPPMVVAELVVRNLVPVAGILFFGWHAFNVLALYLLDTLLMIAVVIAGVARSFLPVDDTSWAGRANTEFGYVAAGLMIAAFIAVPLILMTGGDMAMFGATLADRSFHIGIAIQFAAALWSWLALRRAVDAGYSADALRLKRRFALLFLRWLVVLIVAYTGVGVIAGDYAPLLFVVVYAGVSIVIDIAPDRFLRAMPGVTEDAAPLPGAAPSARSLARRSRRRRRRCG